MCLKVENQEAIEHFMYFVGQNSFSADLICCSAVNNEKTGKCGICFQAFVHLKLAVLENEAGNIAMSFKAHSAWVDIPAVSLLSVFRVIEVSLFLQIIHRMYSARG